MKFFPLFNSLCFSLCQVSSGPTRHATTTVVFRLFAFIVVVVPTIFVNMTAGGGKILT
jgi:hypothetical protein